MNRKLRHPTIGFTAIAVAMALSMLVVLAARPAPGADSRTAFTQAAVTGAEAVAVSALSKALHPASPESRSIRSARSTGSSSPQPAGSASHRRQSLLMPYFSFASRD